MTSMLSTVAFSLLGIDAAIRIYGHITITIWKRRLERAVNEHYRREGGIRDAVSGHCRGQGGMRSGN